MQNSWDNGAAAGLVSPLALRAWSSRLIGSNSELVLHGGGNTSFKSGATLHVKATGCDLGAVREHNFVALDLASLRGLLDDPGIDDAGLMRRIDDCKLDPLAPRPSIETLLHAVLPQPWVEHAHADAILAVANVETCEETCAEVFGELAPVVPYRHSGAALARACRQILETRATGNTIGLVLAFHGVVAFGNDARESYGNLLRLVNQAEDWLKNRGAWVLPEDTMPVAPAALQASCAQLRDRISALAGFPLGLHLDHSPQAIAWARRKDLTELATQGPPTPQHAIHTRRQPLLDADVAAYTHAYRRYLEKQLGEQGRMLDATPRIAIDPGFGVCAFGVNQRQAEIAAEIYRHGIAIMSRASAHGRYRAAPAPEIARAELDYGGFERRVPFESGVVL